MCSILTFGFFKQVNTSYICLLSNLCYVTLNSLSSTPLDHRHTVLLNLHGSLNLCCHLPWITGTHRPGFLTLGERNTAAGAPTDGLARASMQPGIHRSGKGRSGVKPVVHTCCRLCLSPCEPSNVFILCAGWRPGFLTLVAPLSTANTTHTVVFCSCPHQTQTTCCSSTGHVNCVLSEASCLLQFREGRSLL